MLNGVIYLDITVNADIWSKQECLNLILVFTVEQVLSVSLTWVLLRTEQWKSRSIHWAPGST